jgi:hypothetical protein
MSRQSSFGQALLNGKLKLTQWTMAGTLLGKSRPSIVAWPSHNRRLGFGHDCLNHPLTQYCLFVSNHPTCPHGATCHIRISMAIKLDTN